MKISERTLRFEEQAMLTLRAIYEQNGYTPYSMSKFEEYDLYAANRAFLRTDEIITFTDLGGRLMALKPDVTLSIVKNDPGDSTLRKVYYNENVYRVAGGTHEFREIMQSGLECIGDIDLFSVCEVLNIASKSLTALGGEHLLAISHMGLLSGLLDESGLTDEQKASLLACISAKNSHSLADTCLRYGVSADLTDKLTSLAALYMPLADSISLLRSISISSRTDSVIDELEQIAASGCADGIMLDFSLVNDMNYYNGIIFQGFISGIPEAVLSGGRYDNLLARFGRSGGAVGFAVYIDQLSRLCRTNPDNDVDVLLLYDDSSKLNEVLAAAEQLRFGGSSVRVQKEDNGQVRCGRRLVMRSGKVGEE